MDLSAVHVQPHLRSSSRNEIIVDAVAKSVTTGPLYVVIISLSALIRTHGEPLVVRIYNHKIVGRTLLVGIIVDDKTVGVVFRIPDLRPRKKIKIVADSVRYRSNDPP